MENHHRINKNDAAAGITSTVMSRYYSQRRDKDVE